MVSLIMNAMFNPPKSEHKCPYLLLAYKIHTNKIKNGGSGI